MRVDLVQPPTTGGAQDSGGSDGEEQPRSISREAIPPPTSLWHATLRTPE